MTDHVEAFPLRWPDGRPRMDHPDNAKFQTTLGKAIKHLMNEIRLLGGTDAILSSNLNLRIDGLPYANQRAPEDSGVAVYFMYKKAQHCFACDDWWYVKDNVRAIGKTIEALRGISRWGTGDMIERAFQGFVALPAPESKRWYAVLGFDCQADAFFQGDFEIRSKKLLSQYHPDKPDGDGDKFKSVMAARERGREVRDK